MESISQCRALNVSDEKRCEETATSVNGMFCGFHSKQCQGTSTALKPIYNHHTDQSQSGLYRGYKLRNERLDRLNASPPEFLAESSIALSAQDFEDVESKEVCHEIHKYLFMKLQLLDRVIRARKLHHSRFFSLDMDYGHSKYLDSLLGQKATITQALERLERRTAEANAPQSLVLYKHEQWFKWVRECQNEEEESREKEQQKVKKEAALFKRHWKAAQHRMRDFKAKEDKKRQDAYLEKVYKERLAEQETEEEDSDDMDWDPIEDVLEDNRGNFVDLIQHFLWMSVVEDVNDANEKEDVEMSNSSASASTAPPAKIPAPAKEPKAIAPKKMVAAPTKKAKAKALKNKAATGKAPAKDTPSPKPQPVQEPIPDKDLIETQAEMHSRLKHGSDYNHGKIAGVMVAGTMENPIIQTKTITFPEDEIQQLLAQVSEIKYLLFCRLLLGHATLLPAALRANTVDEFLADEEVSTSALRDICLKMERPGLQEIRDACADLFRSDEEEDEDEIIKARATGEEDEYDEIMKKRIWQAKKQRGALPEKWVSERQKAKQALGSMLPTEGNGVVDFGRSNAGDKPSKKIRVKICGRYIWNYPSDKAMNRGGWLQFCILAKDSRLHDAVALCRHWDEFFELNILASWQYFPAANWAEWVGSRYRQQMLQLGFIMYFESTSPDAMDLTIRHQTGGRGQNRRSHAHFEARNFICAHIKRDDQVSRRLVQYLAMQTHEILVLVRDAESGKLLITPPEDERWLYRQKSGLGRAVKNEWNVIRSIGPQFFEEMDRYREWHFSFNEYYDVYVWDVAAGECFAHLYNLVQNIIIKAHRCRSGVDLYRPAESILRTLYHDEESHRPREIKPEDKGKVLSIWEGLNSEGTNRREKPPTFGPSEWGTGDDMPELQHSEPHRNLFYNDTDALEDAVLFPEELSSAVINPLEIGRIEPIKKWQDEGFSLARFVKGMDLVDSDDEEMLPMHVEEQGLTDGESSEESSIASSEAWDDLDDDDDEDEIDEDPSRNATMQKLFRVMQKNPNPKKEVASDSAGIEAEFMTFMDREKARLFKEVWHNADLEPHAQVHYKQMLEMAKKSRTFVSEKLDVLLHPICQLAIDLIDDLDVEPDDTKDLNKAVALITPFFFPDFLESKKGQKFKNSLLFNQVERAKHPPTFYKSGVLRTRADEYFAGQAISNTSPNRETPDLFIDYRIQIPTITMPPGMQDPHSIPSFRTLTSNFTKKHPSARFSILTLWSAPHFYPLMIGPHNHDATAFRDLIGRRFIWMFVPKDMPCSEWSIHMSARMRVMPWKKSFGDKVVVKRDKYLVMGETEEECRRLTVACAFAIQMRPWRWEVDLWKSFVGVDTGFVEGLDDAWLD
ncbi:hypothetical protein LAWI1_G006032 [Lachnellula willkommii]|uniref:Mfs allantoate protein n=1 Tax=Lachnellula willkommii TaxID=215461 RepID=A0A559M3Z2_9HELO|nr:hypothetical protein LAWI1_G006032 [Lachnellula willkommii]